MSAAEPPPTAPRAIRWWWEDFAPGSVRDFGPQPFHLDDAADGVPGPAAASV